MQQGSQAPTELLRSELHSNRVSVFNQMLL